MKTQMNLVPFRFWADWTVRAVLTLKVTALLLKYPNFVCVFLSYFYGQNNYVSINCRVRAKKLINIKVRKLQIFL